MKKPKIPMFTTIVFGGSPEAQSANAKKIMRAYGQSRVFRPWEGRVIRKGALHMTDVAPSRSREDMEKKAGFPIRLVSFETAMEMVKIDEELKL